MSKNPAGFWCFGAAALSRNTTRRKIGRPIFAFQEKSEGATASGLALFLPFVRNPFRNGRSKNAGAKKSKAEMLKIIAV